MSRPRGAPSVALSFAVVVCAIALSACDLGNTATTAPSAAGSGAPTAAAAGSEQPANGASPSADQPPSPMPEITEVASPSASATATIGTGAVCGGTPENQRFWSQAASWLQFAVFCPVLPAGWYLASANFETKNGGLLTAAYAGQSGAKIEIKEGSVCSSGLSACSPHDVVLGTASFGDLPGSLDSLGPGLGYAIYISPGTPPSWQAIGTNVEQDAFVAFVAALVKVPKP